MVREPASAGPQLGLQGPLPGVLTSTKPLGLCQPTVVLAIPPTWRDSLSPGRRGCPCRGSGIRGHTALGGTPGSSRSPRFPASAGTKTTGSPRGRRTSTTSPRTSGPSWRRGWPSSSSSRYAFQGPRVREREDPRRAGSGGPRACPRRRPSASHPSGRRVHRVNCFKALTLVLFGDA